MTLADFADSLGDFAIMVKHENDAAETITISRDRLHGILMDRIGDLQLWTPFGYRDEEGMIAANLTESQSDYDEDRCVKREDLAPMVDYVVNLIVEETKS
jgi:hypothetical protein